MLFADAGRVLAHDRDDLRVGLRLVKGTHDSSLYVDNRLMSDSETSTGEFDEIECATRERLCEAFDKDWYRSKHTDLRGLDIDFLKHYIDYGRHEGRSPRADFDAFWYAEYYLERRPESEAFLHWVTQGRSRGNHPNMAALVRHVISIDFDAFYYLIQNAGLSDYAYDMVTHYIEVGVYEGRNPHSEFDTHFYLNNNEDVRNSGLNPFFHFLAYGRAEGRLGRAGADIQDNDEAFCGLLDVSTKRIDAQEAMFERIYSNRADYALNAECLLFDSAWYWNHAQRNTDEASLPSLVHYRTRGWSRKYWPHPLFDPIYYVRRCEEFGLEVDSEPLQHYHDIGARSGVSPHPLFDHNWYANELSRVGRSRDDASLTDYLYHGWQQGLDPHPLFCSQTYRKHADPGTLADLHHYVVIGWYRRASPHVLFDTAHYLNQPLAEKAFLKGINPLAHYLVEGCAAGLSPHADFDPKWYTSLFCAPTWTRSALEHFVFYGQRPIARLSGRAEFDFNLMSIIESKRDNRNSPCPLVSIIIVNWNGAHHLDALFHSLLDQTYSNFEVIFVDNASNDRSLEIVRSLWSDAKIIALSRNAGFAEANNLGYNACQGELIALLNNDTQVDSNWLSELVAAIGRYPEAGAVTSRVRFLSKFRSVLVSAGGAFSLD